MEDSTKQRLAAFRKQLVDELIKQVACDVKQDNEVTEKKYHMYTVEYVAKMIETDNDHAFVTELFKEMIRVYADNETYCARMFDAYKKQPALTEHLSDMETYYVTAKKEFPVYSPAYLAYNALVDAYNVGLEKEILYSKISNTLYQLKDARDKLTLVDYREEFSGNITKLQQIYLEHYQLPDSKKCN